MRNYGYLPGKESAGNAGDLGSVLGLGRSPGEAKGYPLQYSSLENSMDCNIVHGVAKSSTWLSDFHFHEEMDTISLSSPLWNFVRLPYGYCSYSASSL